MARITWNDRVDNVAPDNLVDAALLNEIKAVTNEGFQVHEYTVLADAAQVDVTVPFALKDNIRVFRDGLRVGSSSFLRLSDTQVRLFSVIEQEFYIIES